MKVAIIGAGGIGGYFGAKLAKAGCDVTFVARGEHLKALQKNGLVVKSIKGDFKVDTVKATDQIKNIDKPELVIVCTKAWQVKDAAKELKNVIAKDTILLPLQNGVLAADELKEYIPSENVIGGLCRIISMIDSPGVISHIGVDPLVVFGELNNSKTERLNKIKSLFDKSGVNSKIPDDIQAELWKKFIAICISGLLAITKSTYGEVREIKETRKLIVDLFTEVYMLSQKIGINIEPDFVNKTVAFIDSLPYDSTTSLSRDVLEGKPSEIEYQNGTVVKLGEKYGLNTPVNRFIYSCILPMEMRVRKK